MTDEIKDPIQNVGQTDENQHDNPEPSQIRPQVSRAQVLPNIAKKLSENSNAGEDPTLGQTNGAKPAEPPAFDISKLTVEQLQVLKSMLNVTPDQVTRAKTIKPKISLPRVDGRFIVEIKRAYLKSMRDLELNRDVERHVLPVRFHGDTKFTEMIYADFINAERVKLEVKGVVQNPERIEEGSTISRLTGLPVAMERVQISTKFIIQLPSGEEVTIEGQMANA